MSITDVPVTVIITTFYTGPILFRVIESVLKQNILVELIVINNGNPPEIEEQLRQMSPQIKLVSGQGNIGFARACNIGAKLSTNDYILFLNPDCLLLSENTISLLLKELSSNKAAFMASCCQIDSSGNEHPTNVRNILTPNIMFYEACSIAKFLPSKYNINIFPQKQSNKALIVPAVSGAIMLFDKKKYWQIGGMDEQYFLHVEDLDICKKIKDAGGKILYLPYVKVLHYLSTSNTSNFLIEQHKTCSFLYYFHKHYIQHKLFNKWLLFALSLRLDLIKLVNKFKRSHNSTNRYNNIIKYLNKEDVGLNPFNEESQFIVTGSSSILGLAIMRKLLNYNQKVTALYCNNPINFNHVNLNWQFSNLTNEKLILNKSLSSHIIHAAPLWLLPNLIKSMPKGTLKRIVAFSSTSIFTKAFSANSSEQLVINKLKLAEQEVKDLCKDNDIIFTILRPTLIYGAGLDKNLSTIVNFIEKFGFWPIYGQARGLRQPVNVEDLAKAAIDIINNPNTFNKSYNLGGGEVLSYYNMVARIFSLLDKKTSIKSVPMLPKLINIFASLTRNKSINGEMASRMNINMVFDNLDANKDFGYNPGNFLANGLYDLGKDI